MPDSPRLVVVDASVVLKWQLGDEQYVAQAVAIKDDFLIRGAITLIAPHLLVCEVINGILSAVKKKRIKAGLVREMVGNFLAAGVELRSADPWRIVELSAQYNISAYDAAYVALAQAEGCDLWTGDRPLYQAVRQYLPAVRWIGDYVSIAGA